MCSQSKHFVVLRHVVVASWCLWIGNPKHFVSYLGVSFFAGMTILCRFVVAGRFTAKLHRFTAKVLR